MEKVNLTILNITSWCGQCADATHVYGTLILCTNPEVTIDNIEEYDVKYLGERIELRQLVTLEIAKSLDRKSGGKTYERMVQLITEYPDVVEGNDTYGTTNRFDTYAEVENFAIAKWKELNLGCPFISLDTGEKYDFDYNGESGHTKILYYERGN